MASNFFAQQDLARRNTRIIILFFVLAVAGLLLLTNILVVFGLGLADPAMLSANQPLAENLPWDIIFWVSLIISAAVGLAILLKWYQLRQGGRVVAESLGGIRIAVDTTDKLQRRLLNVVEEMALAANLPVPTVYLLPERAINAFAAGYSPADAVIGITQGCLETLDRDELQGVVAHEFSHILNGDMRMNIRMIAVLNGILFLGLIGYHFLRSGQMAHLATRSRNSKNNSGGIVLLGIGLIVIGYVGVFFGNLMKAAVSRQREFLADASAVQFTRNPRGIASALKQIGAHASGSKMQHANTDENSHLFFGEAISRWAAIFATHPPLTQRIKRLDPFWDGKFPSPHKKQQVTAEETSADTAKTERQQSILAGLPLLLLQSSQNHQYAQALVCALLLNEQQAVRTEQLHLIKETGSISLLQQVDQLCDSAANLTLKQKVHLLQRLIPALKTLTELQFVQFEQLLQALVNADKRVDLLEWITLNFIDHTVATEFRSSAVVRHTSGYYIRDIQTELLLLVSSIAGLAGNEEQQTQSWQAALGLLELPLTTARPAADFGKLTAILPKLLATSPTLKQQLWQVLLVAVEADKLQNEDEQALLLALALLLEIPYTPDL